MYEICPICDGVETRRLLRLRQQPASSALLPSAAAARAVKSADIGLRYCPSCDHLYNDLFDSADSRYPRAHPLPAYAQEFFQYITRRFPLKGKQVIDVGTMDGRLLVELAQMGSRGIGLVPSGAADVPDITWIDRPFSRDYLNLPADLVLCRQTPQHVWNVRDLFRNLHALAFDWHAPVLFEAQNSHAMLNARDVWSLRYERCHYFSPRSLWQAVKAVRFTPTMQTQPCDGQLLSLLTMPLATPLHLPPPDAVSLIPFLDAIQLNVAEWTATLGQMRQQQDRVVLWGASERAVTFLNALPTRGVVACVVDDESAETFIPRTAHPVRPIAFLTELAPHVIIIMDEKSRDDVERLLPSLSHMPTIMNA